MTPDWPFKKYHIWDPCWCRWKNHWYTYMLAHKVARCRDRSVPAFLRRNHVVGFRSEDWQTWEPLGDVLHSPHGQVGIVNAGDVVPDGDLIHLYFSDTHFLEGVRRMGQELLWATSSDGIKFETREPPFVPAGPEFTTGKHNPKTGEPLYPCRDPYVFQGFDDKWYMYITAGGGRWGVPPRQVVAVAPTAGGPWEVAGVALDDPKWKGLRTLGEVERASVVYSGGSYWLLASGMFFFRGSLRQLKRDGFKVGRRSVFVFRSDSPLGPFEFDESVGPALIFNDPQAGIYWGDAPCPGGIGGLGRFDWSTVLADKLIPLPKLPE